MEQIMQSIKNFAIVFLVLIANVNAQTLTKKEIDDIRGSTISSCVRTQRASSMNLDIKDKQLREYCSCYAATIFPAHITSEEVRNGIAIQRRNGDKAMLEFFLKGRDLYEISENCVNKVFK